MSAPPSLLRLAPKNARKVPSMAPSCQTGRGPLNVARHSSRRLATVQNDHRVLPDVGFAGSGRRSSIPGPNADDPHRKPDERTLKLGKSKSSLLSPVLELTRLTFLSSSSCPPRPPPNASPVSPPAGDPLPANHPPSLPVHAPAPSHRLRARRLLRCPLDIPNRMGPRPYRGERQAADHLRAHDQESPALPLHRPAALRAADRAMADDREDEE